MQMTRAKYTKIAMIAYDSACDHIEMTDGGIQFYCGVLEGIALCEQYNHRTGRNKFATSIRELQRRIIMTFKRGEDDGEQ